MIWKITYIFGLADKNVVTSIMSFMEDEEFHNCRWLRGDGDRQARRCTCLHIYGRCAWTMLSALLGFEM